jgi:hypothetical protein
MKTFLRLLWHTAILSTVFYGLLFLIYQLMIRVPSRAW